MLLSVQGLTKRFPVARGLFGKSHLFVSALRDVSFEMAQGEVLGIVGESGCGKSTLGRCVVGLYPATEGKVFWEGRDLSGLSKEEKRGLQPKFQMVFQNPFSSLNPRQKVRSILEEPLLIHGRERSIRTEKVLEIIEKVGLSKTDLEKFPHEFSGGQRQRINLARALVSDPQLIVLDEPVSSLDVSIQASILNLLKKTNRDTGVGYFFISHDLQVVGFLSQRVLVMYLGKVVEQGNTTQVLQSPRHPYTKALLEASLGKGTVLSGEPPSPTQVPSGCPFSSRCPHVEDRCRVENQELKPISGEWAVACWKWAQIN
jgi:oligopeptide/dipeptide ABC transporter ATP-binding protein